MERQKISKTGCLENTREAWKITLVVRSFNCSRWCSSAISSVLPEWILWMMVDAGRWSHLKLVMVDLGDHKLERHLERLWEGRSGHEHKPDCGLGVECSNTSGDPQTPMSIKPKNAWGCLGPTRCLPWPKLVARAK